MSEWKDFAYCVIGYTVYRYRLAKETPQRIYVIGPYGKQESRKKESLRTFWFATRDAAEDFARRRAIINRSSLERKLQVANNAINGSIPYREVEPQTLPKGPIQLD